MYKTLL